MLPLRFMLGFITLWFLVNIGCNWLSGLAMTANVPAGLDPNTGVGGVTSTQSTDTSGAPATYMSLNANSINVFEQWAFFDYPALFNDPITGLPDEFRSALRFGMLIIVGLGFLLSLAVVTKNLFSVGST
jgi:hypothetical protein